MLDLFNYTSNTCFNNAATIDDVNKSGFLAPNLDDVVTIVDDAKVVVAYYQGISNIKANPTNDTYTVIDC